MTTEDLAALVRRFHKDFWGEGDLEVADELFTADCIVTDNNETMRGPRALKDHTAGFRWAFPDITYVLDEVLGDPQGAVLSRWHGEGTHSGEFQGVPATGAQLSYWGLGLFRLQGDRISHAWIASTLAEALDHLRAETERTQR